MQLVVGRIGRAHGIKGEVTVEVRTDDPDRRFAPGAELRTDPLSAGPLTVAAARWHSGRLLLSLQGVRDRSAAEALRGTLLLCEVDISEPLDDPEEFYDSQLIGLAAVTVSGARLGEIVDVLHLPGQDVLAVAREAPPGSPPGPPPVEVLLPFVAAIVPEVRLAEGLVVVDPPPGLVEPDEAV